MTGHALASLGDSLPADAPLRVVAAGKAAIGMAQACASALGPRVSAGLITAPAHAVLPRWRAIAASHPTPSATSEEAGRFALELADATKCERGVLLVCLSGGASAMLAVPAEGLTIDDKAATTAALLAAGLDIGAINTVRRHLSAIKGGQLAARAGRTITLAISDVCTPVEDDPAAIGSGPTVGDPSSFADALRIIEDAGLTARIPAAALTHLRDGAAGRRSGPVPPGAPALHASAYWIIATRRHAMRAAAHTAERIGYRTIVVDEPTTGPARAAGPALVQRALSDGGARPLCLIASGETTVDVRGQGRGGRNQELALAALAPLADAAPAALASFGTDGVDGPTDAAGAFVDSDTFAALGPDAAGIVQRALDDNDAYPLLDRLGVLIRRGPTGTNVGDLQVLLLA